MDGARFDRFARNVAKGVSRRGMLAALGGLALAGSQRARASQLTPSTCGASGEVCTMLMGCCDGLTCVTSAINTNYGVCVTGEGGTVSIGTTLISPFSENVEQEVAAIAASETTSTTTTTTDPEAEREQLIAERKSRRSSRRNDRQLRRSTNQNEQQDRREDLRLARDARRGPKLSLEFFPPTREVNYETVRATNRDDVDIALTWIESFPRASATTELTLPQFTLDPGDSFRFASGFEAADATNRYAWSNSEICATEGETGFLIRAGFSTFTESFEFVILCDGSSPSDGAGKARRKKRRRGQNGGKDKNRNRNGG